MFSCLNHDGATVLQTAKKNGEWLGCVYIFFLLWLYLSVHLLPVLLPAILVVHARRM